MNDLPEFENREIPWDVFSECRLCDEPPPLLLKLQNKNFLPRFESGEISGGFLL